MDVRGANLKLENEKMVILLAADTVHQMILQVSFKDNFA